MIGVCCDSGAQLPAALAAEHGIEVIPLHVTIDGTDHLEGVDLDADGFWERFTGGRTPQVTTAAPSPGQIAVSYQRLVDHGSTAIVSVHTGADLSGTLSSARLATQLVGAPVELVDTKSASFVVGCAALAAAERAARGEPASAAADAARRTAARCENVFVVGALDLARAGGRLAGDVAEPGPAGSLPVLRLTEGKLTVIGDVRSRGEAAKLMASKILATGDRLRVGVGVADPAARPIARLLRRHLQAAAGDIELIDYRVGPSVGAHTGPGTAGAVYHARDG